jgi:acetolactate synthase-1/2/3 large subunit
LNSHYAAVDEETGLYFPDYQKIAEAFKIPYFTLKSNRDLKKLPQIWSQKGPFLCDVQTIESQKIVPMLKFGAGIEDLDPKIPKEELDAIVQECEQIEADNLTLSKG